MGTCSQLRQSLLLLLLCLPTLIFAQSALTLGANTPRSNDKMEREVFFMDIKRLVSEQNFWDLSDIEVVGRKPLQYVSDGDSTILEISNGIVSAYQVKDNACWLLGYETPLFQLKFSEPLKTLSYPLSFGNSYQTCFTAKGMYSKEYAMEKEGRMQVVVDAQGGLLLNDGDTLQDVLRVHYAINSKLYMSNGTLIFDTLQTRQEKRNVYRWYAKGYRYPILEVATSQILCQGQVLTENSSAYLLSPNEQSSLFDRDNETIRGRLQKENATSKANQQEILSDLQTHASDGKLEISCKLSAPCKLKIIVSDISGVIYQQKTANGTNEYINHEYIDCSSLRRGEYIVYVFAYGKVYSSKFSIQ